MPVFPVIVAVLSALFVRVNPAGRFVELKVNVSPSTSTAPTLKLTVSLY